MAQWISSNLLIYFFCSEKNPHSDIREHPFEIFCSFAINFNICYLLLKYAYKQYIAWKVINRIFIGLKHFEEKTHR